MSGTWHPETQFPDNYDSDGSRVGQFFRGTTSGRVQFLHSDGKEISRDEYASGRWGRVRSED